VEQRALLLDTGGVGSFFAATRNRDYRSINA
jgi:hypothetical protein